jgi:Cof subfamily protein (haloacid dehalogenase superfamily)
MTSKSPRSSAKDTDWLDDWMPPQRIRLVAVDLDGTLLTDSKRVSEQTVEAFKCLPARDARVVIASARPPRSVRHIYNELGLQTLSIHYNGAMIWDEPKQRVMYHQPMECATARSIIDMARDMFDEVSVSCEVLDKWYTDRDIQPYTTQTGLIFRPDRVAPLDEFCNQPITKLLLLGEPMMLSKLEPILMDGFGADVSIGRSDAELIQIMDRRASKGNALKLVADYYGVPMSDVMAIGDELNDVSMLKLVGAAVAMDNAHPSVKSIAHWVAPSNNDHGVHAALRRWGLCD